MPDLKVGDDLARTIDLAELEGARRDRSTALTRAYAAEEKAAKAQEQSRLLGERLHRLEALGQSAFARSVRTLSASRGQLGRSVEADRVVQLVEEHLEVTRFLDEQQVPGDKLLPRVRWLHDKATQTIVEETVEFFTSIGPIVVESQGEDVPPQLPPIPLFRCKRRKIPGDGGLVDGCGWQGLRDAMLPTASFGEGCCPVCGSPTCEGCRSHERHRQHCPSRCQRRVCRSSGAPPRAGQAR